MLPWFKGYRNFGWVCKYCGDNIPGGVQLYYCPYCGVNPANEYCLNCASNKLHWKCPRYGCLGKLIPG